MKQKIPWLIAILLSALFLLIPFPPSRLRLRIVFQDPVSEGFQLYYIPEGQTDFTAENCITPTLSEDNKTITFTIDPDLADRIQKIRLDLPGASGDLVATQVRLSGGGFVKKQWNPCKFFSVQNTAAVHDLEITRVESRQIVHLTVQGEDPYTILSDDLTGELSGAFSHHLGSRVLLLVFLWCMALFYQLDLFGSKNK